MKLNQYVNESMDYNNIFIKSNQHNIYQKNWEKIKNGKNKYFYEKIFSKSLKLS